MASAPLQKLPLNISDFQTLIKRNCIYVDKTKMLYELAHGNRFYFITRPRRFDKSLLLSTLNALYIRLSFQHDIIESYKKILNERVSNDAKFLAQDLSENNMDDFCKHIKPVLAQIPYEIQIQKEAYYHSMFHAILSMLPHISISELQTDKDRIDLLLETEDTYYIFEFKLKQSAQVALTQIIDRAYYERFSSSDKKVILVGISFNSNKTDLDFEYAVKEL